MSFFKVVCKVYLKATSLFIKLTRNLKSTGSYAHKGHLLSTSSTFPYGFGFEAPQRLLGMPGKVLKHKACHIQLRKNHQEQVGKGQSRRGELGKVMGRALAAEKPNSGYLPVRQGQS